jgi:hypothetical protein
LVKACKWAGKEVVLVYICDLLGMHICVYTVCIDSLMSLQF